MLEKLKVFAGDLTWVKTGVAAGIAAVGTYVTANVPVETVVETTTAVLASKGFWGGAAATFIAGFFAKAWGQKA